jgi:pyridoxamine 5'-phosphate oxidase
MALDLSGLAVIRPLALGDLQRIARCSAPMSSASKSPLDTLAAWVEEAGRAGIIESSAMALATANKDGVPSVRFVLGRGIDDAGVRFYTNYDSRKARELDENPRAAAAFYWEPLHRQVRIEGTIERLTAAESDAYFKSRARGSQLSASVSPQSAPIRDLETLVEKRTALEAALLGRDVPRPENWGGYLLRASSVELWVSGADRLHDRVLYTRRAGAWDSVRLAP